jgi:hypothetical protein
MEATHMNITYKHWDGTQRIWDPDAPGVRYYILTDKVVTSENDGTFNELVFHSFKKPSPSWDTLPNTLEGVREGFQALMQKYPKHAWQAANPRIVKAPCALDAPQAHVVVEQIFQEVR